MEKNAKNSLKKHLKDFPQLELEELAEIASIAGNRVLYEALEEISGISSKSKEKKTRKKHVFFDVCKFGTAFSYELFGKESANFLDENGNNCLHYAAKYGNLQVFHVFSE